MRFIGRLPFIYQKAIDQDTYKQQLDNTGPRSWTSKPSSTSPKESPSTPPPLARSQPHPAPEVPGPALSGRSASRKRGDLNTGNSSFYEELQSFTPPPEVFIPNDGRFEH
jgi:hypothetical protein